MLVLNRKRDETVVIRCPDGTEIVVMVVQIRGDHARLGFTAPPGVTIHRGEVQDRIDAEKAAEHGG